MQKKSSANFLYRLGIVTDQKILLIWDKNLGNRTVTNDIENVVADIAAHENLDAEDYLIFYKDSEGTWTGWEPSLHQFYHCAMSDSFLLSMHPFPSKPTQSLMPLIGDVPKHKLL